MIKTKANRRRSTTDDRENNQGSEGMDNPLHKAFLDEIADIYNAEQQLIKALPRMQKAAQSTELQDAIESHLRETEQQASASRKPWKPWAKPCRAKNARPWRACSRKRKK